MRAPGKDPRDDAALTRAIEQMLGPLARLAIARGLTFPALKELLKQEFVRAARAAQPGGGARDISRVATATGLTRREVTRLSLEKPPALADRPSPATQLFTRWQADRKLRDRRGKPKALPRQGPAPSFEALAQAITRDVHPRSLLDELVRLGLAAHDAQTDTVRLLEDAFVPRNDQARMVGFLGQNVGDHLAATVANVLGDKRQHFEQALFADELSDPSVAAAKKLVNAQWRGLMAALVPELEELARADQAATKRNPAHRADRRLRVGLYSFDDTMKSPGGKDS
ncbi:MAG: DUF6502 family protein [Burkholderiaceae bacterium]|nr:DUF6502 family protein [Burkholderiaceae bacterium]